MNNTVNPSPLHPRDTNNAGTALDLWPDYDEYGDTSHWIIGSKYGEARYATCGEDLAAQKVDAQNLIAAFALIVEIANFTKDGELDENGDEFELENDDAVDSLHEIISSAREILDLPDRYPGD